MIKIQLRFFVWVCVMTLWVSNKGVATPSPSPGDLLPSGFEFSIPTLMGAIRGAYKDVSFGTMLYDSGPSPVEETTPGEVRRWIFQAAGGSIRFGSSSYQATCIRASRTNVLLPTQEFYYQFRVSALDGGCTEKEENRSVELVFVMRDFVLKNYSSGTSRFFKQQTDLLMYPTALKAPDKADAYPTSGGYYLTGNLGNQPFVANLQLEFLLRPKGEMFCGKTKFNPDTDPFSSVLALPDANGKWGTTVVNTGGAICMRLIGGGWKSAVTGAILH